MTTETKFTKGPWAMCHRGESLKGAAGQDVVIWGCGLTNGCRTDEADANSALIAVAPEMYRALEMVCNSVSKTETVHAFDCIRIEQLLAKARGYK